LPLLDGGGIKIEFAIFHNGKIHFGLPQEMVRRPAFDSFIRTEHCVENAWIWEIVPAALWL
jgi:hypothetical protein